MDSTTVFLLILVGAFLLIGIGIQIIAFIKEFAKELEYQNAEIARTTGREQEYWKRKKRRLWRSVFPVFRK